MIDSGVSLVILCICGTDAGFGLEILVSDCVVWGQEFTDTRLRPFTSL